MASSLAPGKKENNLLSTISLGFSLSGSQTCSSIITCFTEPWRQWAAYKASFQHIAASEDQPSSPPIFNFGPRPHYPPKAK